jgi:hypothetical protein
MKDFKSSTSRLARLFKKSRDAWKGHSADKQKKIRALKIKIRIIAHNWGQSHINLCSEPFLTNG